MKIKQILEARYATQKPSVLDVHYVSQRYKRFVNNYESAYDLWDEGKPTIHQKGTISKGFTSLEFSFQNKSKKDAEQWVRNFIGTVKLPYTKFSSRAPQRLDHLIAGNENEYTQVVIKYEEHGIHEARYAGEHPVVKAIKSALAREADFYINIKDKKRAEAAERGIIAGFGPPDEQGPATEDEYRNLLWYLPDEIMQLQIIDGLNVHKKKIVRGQPVVSARKMMNISLL